MSGTLIDTDERIHLIVVFGGESAEHDVSCTTAAHVLAAADPAKYRITPIGISTNGQWAIADQAVAADVEGAEVVPLGPRGGEGACDVVVLEFHLMHVAHPGSPRRREGTVEEVVV